MDSLVKISGLELETLCKTRLAQIAQWRTNTEAKVYAYLSSLIVSPSRLFWWRKPLALTEAEIKYLMTNYDWSQENLTQHEMCYTNTQYRVEQLLECSKAQEIYLTVSDYLLVTTPIDVDKLFFKLT